MRCRILCACTLLALRWASATVDAFGAGAESTPGLRGGEHGRAARPTRPADPMQKHKLKAKPLPTLDSLAGVLNELGGEGSKGGASTRGGGVAASGRAKHLASKGRGSSVKRLKARQAIA